VGGFTGWDWSSAAAAPRRRRSDPIEQYVTRFSLSMREAQNPEIVDRTRATMVANAEHWTRRHGYQIRQVQWATDNEIDPALVTLTLVSEVTPRTDGEWPSIRAAIEQDEADRAAARSPAGRTAAAMESTGDAARTVSDRLEALRRSAAVWGARTPSAVRKALSDR